MVEESKRSDPEFEIQHDINEYIESAQLPPAEILDLDFIYTALAHPRRRYIIYSLLSNTRWTLDELAAKLVSWEQDIPEDSVAGFDRDEMHVSLYHTHIPVLVDRDIVEYEEETEAEIITPGTNATQVLAVLEGAGASLDDAQETHAMRDFQSE